MNKNRYLLLFLFFIPITLLANVKPLAVDQAFSFSAAMRDNQTMLAVWKIAPGYYLYRDRIHFNAVNPKQNRLAQPIFPTTRLTKHYPQTGKVSVYNGHLTIPVPIIHSDHETIMVKVNYQGCSENGFCYPPTTRVVQLNLNGPYQVLTRPIAIDLPDETTKTTGTQAASKDRIADLLHNANLLTLFAGFWAFGFLISLTPCVLPMIPILSSIIVGQNQKKAITHLRAFSLSLAYVLGMAATYAVAGVVFSLIGSNIQAALQKPWIIVSFSLLFVAMAFSLFGFLNIQLPEGLRSRINALSNRQQHGSFWGVAMMGVLSTLVLSPCVTAPLVGVLTYISQTGNALLGGTTLFVMGLGMGTPLLVIGASSAKLLPKAGAWMNTIKNILGLLMLALAIWMLSRVLPDTLTMGLWALLAFGSALALRAFSSAKGIIQIGFKTLGLAAFVYSLLLALNLYWGNTNPLTPLSFLDHSKAFTASETTLFKRIKTLDALKAELDSAKQSDQITVVDFYADWCLACKEMEHFTFSNPLVQQRLKQTRALQVDVTKNNAADQAIQKAYGVVAPPTILFFYKGHEIPNTRIVGEISAEALLKHLTAINLSTGG